MTTASIPKSGTSSLHYVLVFLYLLSGVCALAYEILWVKALAIFFGASILGVAITVSAFMFGLGFGALAGFRIRQSISRPLLLIGVLEILVAIFAFFLPKFLPVLEGIVFTGAGGSLLFLEVAVTLLLLFLPAFMLGLAFSLFLNYLKAFNASLGLVYGLNTLGGFVGVFLPIMLLPIFGWVVSLRLIALLGILVGVFFIVSAIVSQRKNFSDTLLDSTIPLNVFVAYAIVGFASLSLQFAWTRLFGMVFLRTEYVLAVIIGTFLLGMAIGSLVSRYLNKESLIRALPFVAAFFVLFSLWMLPWASELNANEVSSSVAYSMFSQAIILLVLTFPVTFILGMWYPILTRQFNLRMDQSVFLYAGNAIGAGLGVLVCAFVLVPLFGIATTLGISAALFIVASAIWSKSRKYAYLSLVVSPIVVLLAFQPSAKDLMPEFYNDSVDLFLFEDAITTTHVIQRKDGERLLLNDLQRMDASSEYTAVQSQRNQARLPLVLHPDPESVLFLGLGTGITASGIIDYPGLSITAVELSEGAIIAANDYFDKANKNISEKITIVRDDARRFLTASSDFDIIVGDLFHPDLVGRGSLLSLQHFHRVKEALSGNGLFIQWVALNQFDRENLKIVLKTFATAFPDNALFLDGFRLGLVGFSGAVDITYASLIEKFKRFPDEASLVLDTEDTLNWFARYAGKLNASEINSVMQEDWSPVLEYRLPEVKYLKSSPLPAILAYILEARPATAEAIDVLGIPVMLTSEFERRYQGVSLFTQSLLAGLVGDGKVEFDLLRLAYESNPKDRWISSRVSDQLLANPPSGLSEAIVLQKALEIREDNLVALRGLQALYEKEGDEQSANRLRLRISHLDSYAFFMRQ